MDKIDLEIISKILTEDWAWYRPKRQGKFLKPSLHYGTIIAAANEAKDILYIDRVLFPTYHRFVRKLLGLLEDKEYCELHFEEIEPGEFWFGSDCPECQGAVEIQLDRILTRYCDNHPEWRRIIDLSHEEIDSLVKEKNIPTYQKEMF